MQQIGFIPPVLGRIRFGPMDGRFLRIGQLLGNPLDDGAEFVRQFIRSPLLLALHLLQGPEAATAMVDHLPGFLGFPLDYQLAAIFQQDTFLESERVDASQTARVDTLSREVEFVLDRVSQLDVLVGMPRSECLGDVQQQLQLILRRWPTNQVENAGRITVQVVPEFANQYVACRLAARLVDRRLIRKLQSQPRIE